MYQRGKSKRSMFPALSLNYLNQYLRAKLVLLYSTPLTGDETEIDYVIHRSKSQFAYNTVLNNVE